MAKEEVFDEPEKKEPSEDNNRATIPEEWIMKKTPEEQEEID